MDALVRLKSQFLTEGWNVFPMIFLAEFGDRTFFIAMMLATRFNAIAVYLGCMLGLSACTALSVLIGYASTKFISERILDGISSAVFIVCAIITFYEASTKTSDSNDLIDEASEDVGKILVTNSNLFDDNSNNSFHDSADVLSNPDSSETSRLLEGRNGYFQSQHNESKRSSEDRDSRRQTSNETHQKVLSNKNKLYNLLALVWAVGFAEFVGEIGDRTSIAVILLAGQHPWKTVFLFAMAAFSAVTAIAIIAGIAFAKVLNPKILSIVSGTVFLLFGFLALGEAITGKDFY